MDYIVLFDVATKPSPWLDFPWPFSLVMLTVFFILGELQRDPDDGFFKRNAMRIVVPIVLIGLALGMQSYETDRARYIGMLARGHVNTVEGEVSNVTIRRTSSKSNSVRLCFTVQSEKFCYNSGETTPALTDCSTISPGLWVRVSYHYYGNPILRLEATRDSLDRVNAAFE
jgi:hypothetical protein